MQARMEGEHGYREKLSLVNCLVSEEYAHSPHYTPVFLSLSLGRVVRLVSYGARDYFTLSILYIKL